MTQTFLLSKLSTENSLSLFTQKQLKFMYLINSNQIHSQEIKTHVCWNSLT